MLCPCGSEQTFSQCCQMLISRSIIAESPEQLMRSRYSAYATKQAEYIFHTYASSSQKSQSIDEIAHWANDTKWLKLVIHHTSNVQDNLIENSTPQVEFSAFYLHQGQIWQMRENSNFVMENEQWRYLDGEVSDSTEINKPKRNDLCFCGSKKKFKQCCAKSF